MRFGLFGGARSSGDSPAGDSIGYERYIEVVMGGIQNVNQAQQSVMPAFGDVNDVVEYIDDIYAYLKARADGAIGRGRPERLPK